MPSTEDPAQESPRIVPVDDYVRDELYPGYKTAFGYSKTPEDITERVRTCLEYRDAERLEISTDCGLRRVPRYLAISKMSAAAEAARRLQATG